jgi:hypothetical protein
MDDTFPDSDNNEALLRYHTQVFSTTIIIRQILFLPTLYELPVVSQAVGDGSDRWPCDLFRLLIVGFELLIYNV